MAKPFDASAKYLLEAFPADWPAYLGLAAGGPVRVLDADLSTITSDADKVLLVESPEPWLIHVELQASHDLSMPSRLLRDHVLLDYKHEMPVRSVVLLLRPEADSPSLDGALQRRIPGEDPHHEFRYKVVRAWRQPVQSILEGGLGTLPLAPIADVAPSDLPGVIRRMEERLDRESPEVVGALWTTTLLLMGLRYDKGLTRQLLQGVRGMKESVTYQAILEEGEARGEAKGEAKGVVKGEQRVLLRLGSRRFGPPSAEVVEAIEGISETARIEDMIDRVFDASSWEEVLDTGRSA